MASSHHGPARLDHYLNAHEGHLAKLRSSGFVHNDTLILEAVPGGFCMKGEIACSGGIVITVHKILEVQAGEGKAAVVQTVVYSYNAHVRGQHEFLRYDSVHAHPGHGDPHHRHDCSWETGEERHDSPSWIGAAGWPTLGDFIRIVHDWYWDHREKLPDPDGVPPLGVKG